MRGSVTFGRGAAVFAQTSFICSCPPQLHKCPVSLLSSPPQSLVVSLSYEAVEWDVSSKKQQLLLLKKDKSLHILVHTKMVHLIPSPTFSALSNPFIIFFLSVIIIMLSPPPCRLVSCTHWCPE